MKKKAMAVLLSAVLACSMLSGCQGSNTQASISPIIPEESSSAPASTEPATDTVASGESTPVVEENHDNMYRSELTNEWIDLAIQNQRPIAVMVDNEVYALDHYGVNQSDIVYEMMNSLANDEVTRLMCIVKDWGSITRFGSIRSVRPTNFMIAPEYDAVVIHDGGPFYINDYLGDPWVAHLSGGFARIENGKPREFTEYSTTGEIESRLEAARYSSEYTSYYQGPHWQFADETAPVDLTSVYNSRD